jgi:murein DD-endopeptidase MepM/ murein hydrolase activator NlpD
MAYWRPLLGLVALPILFLALLVQPTPAFQGDEANPTATAPLPVAATQLPTPAATETATEVANPGPEIDWANVEMINEPEREQAGPDLDVPVAPESNPAPAAVAAPAEYITHVVVRGDNLSRIASRYGVSLELLKTINQISNQDLIHVGQLLQIPVGGSTAAPAPPTAAAPATTSGEDTYVVQPGDSLYKIARRFGTTVAALATANNLANPSALQPGQVLQLVQGPSAAPPAAAATVVTTVVPAPTATPAALSSSASGDGASTYTVQRGDSLYKIARRFGTTVQALAAANNLANPNALQPGQIITISQGNSPAAAPATLAPTAAPVAAAPAAGNSYTVQPGDSLHKIAVRFGTTVQAIAAANQIGNVNRLYIGMQLVIPEATLAPATAAPPPSPPPSFIWPVQGRLLQYYRWGHTGLDIEASVGSEIVAAAAGIVEFAGWNSAGYGNLTILDHGDGTRTLYAHQSAFVVEPGQEVEQGQVIGKSGSTGWSTWPHLHLEIIINTRRVNPCGPLPGGC